MVTETPKWILSLAYGTIKLFHFNYSHLFHFSSFLCICWVSTLIKIIIIIIIIIVITITTAATTLIIIIIIIFVVGCLVLEINWWLMPNNMQSIGYAINNVPLRPIHPNRRIHVSHTQQIWGAALWIAVCLWQCCKCANTSPCSFNQQHQQAVGDMTRDDGQV